MSYPPFKFILFAICLQPLINIPKALGIFPCSYINQIILQLSLIGLFLTSIKLEFDEPSSLVLKFVRKEYLQK